MRSIILLITALLTVLSASTAMAGDSRTGAPPDREALEQEMLEARTSLQEAARRLAEISAQLHGEEIREPVVQTIRMMRGPRLGINISDSSDPTGVRVDSIMDDSAAAQADLRVGDVIVAIDGHSLDKEKSATRVLARRVHQHRSEEPLTLRIIREGQERDVRISPAEMKRPAMPPELRHQLSELRGLEPAHSAEIEQQVERHLARAREHMGGNTWIRVRLTSMNDGLGDYFGTNVGVLVLEVPTDSELPIRSGDVILRVANQVVQSPRDMMLAMRRHQGDDAIAVEILRKRQREQVEIAPTDQPLAFMPLPAYWGGLY